MIIYNYTTWSNKHGHSCLYSTCFWSSNQAKPRNNFGGSMHDALIFCQTIERLPQSTLAKTPFCPRSATASHNSFQLSGKAFQGSLARHPTCCNFHTVQALQNHIKTLHNNLPGPTRSTLLLLLFISSEPFGSWKAVKMMHDSDSPVFVPFVTTCR